MAATSPVKIAAFFDVDRTLIDINSGRRWLLREWKNGQISWTQVVRSLSWLMQYRLGWLDFEACANASLARYRHRHADDVLAELSEFAQHELVPRICVQAREAVAQHRKSGHELALLTSGPVFSVRKLAQELEIEHVLCTEVEVAQGRLTGRTVFPLCYGAGKVVRAEDFAKRHAIDLRASYFYSDSTSDKPMLERVGFPRVINPDPRLRLTAIRRGWPIERWHAA